MGETVRDVCVCVWSSLSAGIHIKPTYVLCIHPFILHTENKSCKY